MKVSVNDEDAFEINDVFDELVREFLVRLELLSNDK